MITGATLKTNLRKKVMITGPYAISNDKCSVRLNDFIIDRMAVEGLPITIKSVATMKVTDRVVVVEPNPAFTTIGILQGQRMYTADDAEQPITFQLYGYDSLNDVKEFMAAMPWFCKLYVDDKA